MHFKLQSMYKLYLIKILHKKVKPENFSGHIDSFLFFFKTEKESFKNEF